MWDFMKVAGKTLSNESMRLDVLSNNISNVNTPSFKEEVLRFINEGGGAPTIYEGVNFAEGELLQTDNPLDVAIEGKGFFQIYREGESDYLITRNGSFHIDDEGKLVLPTGDPIMGENGPIFIPEDMRKDLRINEKGEIFSAGEYIDKIRIVDPPYPFEFKEREGDIFRIDGKYVLKSSDNSKIWQGYLESSNVDPAKSMVDMVMIMRHFEISTTVLKTGDNMLNRTVNDVGRV